ncbi:type III pantothenate kinase [Elizabethkingia meningoseptica]|uniref:Type III pantothenate kinase n=1 Tax=Elizabethkingia meningoseptica TaxID=238 RepID=A0A1T3KAW9_ELIME|nr:MULTISPECIES: type III pantothenate kinase [Elizabethkingia]AQX04424.1 type III pantothenate kinase [Elizabethkingia meningoseptica]AQX11889.1 type III pantothenate kinase [Elizabethkingia meningoseptica]AQX46465.1 type III pantothenate kinase [Elizabethkingia meningoseptica]EOR31580.1 Pantothenate kinase type III, CoaX-like protein [Elizabethkingia meningoseptica ATCC 13253 = NBRC 12535]KUY18981.1 type III pantothenate kinase [Elizabethkingia meningoseptica]
MKSIVINIGNTNIRFGLFDGDNCDISWVINTKPYRTSDELFIQILTLYQYYKIEIENIEKIIIGSVVPQLTYDISRAVNKIHDKRPILVDRNTPSGVQAKSKQMGTDIYANLVAAHNLYPGKKKIILDFGTALTASCVAESGETLGVIIAPGIITSLNSLINQTAQLPEIELKKPKSVLGLDTVTCMQSGMVYGFLGMVEGFVDRINQEVNDDCFVIATGGVSHVYKPLTEKIHVADRLHTLKGLYYLGKDL